MQSALFEQTSRFDSDTRLFFQSCRQDPQRDTLGARSASLCVRRASFGDLALGREDLTADHVQLVERGVFGNGRREGGEGFVESAELALEDGGFHPDLLISQAVPILTRDTTPKTIVKTSQIPYAVHHPENTYTIGICLRFGLFEDLQRRLHVARL